MSFALLGVAIAIVSGWKIVNLISQDNIWLICIFVFFIGIGLGISSCSIADALSRCREYQRMKYLFLRYGFRTKIVKQLSQSRCQRDAVLLAARETGFFHQAHSFFTDQGYKWYHILPDQIMKNPILFFHPHFLKSTFIPGKNKRSQRSFDSPSL